MYYRNDQDQLSMEEFFLPFGGRLRKDNRWVRLAQIMPWTHIEEIYAKEPLIKAWKKKANIGKRR